ncbi:hypothetical protein NIES4101_86000 [Calothrix sp. NIES-4101]|nr:hypothetical protein NIES4101_86000 [Calothrix sp. NIES-4101]
MGSDFEQKIDLEKKFSRVFSEIKRLESKINKKQGFWFFETHIYSQEDLFNSEHHSKIDSITEKIGSDVISWNRFGQLTEEARYIYEIKRDEVQFDLERVDDIIAQREPTWWEQVESLFKDFIVKVQTNMPQLERILLTTGLLQKIPVLSGFFKKMPKPLGGK